MMEEESRVGRRLEKLKNKNEKLSKEESDGFSQQGKNKRMEILQKG